MRVAIIAGPYIPVPPVKYGGTERVIYHLIKGLKELGHDPVLFGTADSKVDCEVIPLTDSAIYFPIAKRDVPAHLEKVDNLYKKAVKILRKELPNFDIVHSHGFDLIHFQDFPNLTTIHGPINFDQFEYYAKRQNLYFASVSQNQQEAFPDLQYIGVVYNGVDPADFPLVEEPEDYVCFLGRFDREKNPHLAIHLAINAGLKIKLAGKIDYQAEGYFEEEIKPYLSHPNVEFLGELGFNDKVELLSHAKCNLHPTGFREPFGLTVLEAAVCGTPTLAVERGSMPELIEPGRTGILVEDFVEGYHQIGECFNMDRKYIAKRARSLFNYKVMAKQYLLAYENVIDIFNTRSRHNQEILKLTSKTQSELKLVWKAQINQPKHKNNKSPVNQQRERH